MSNTQAYRQPSILFVPFQSCIVLLRYVRFKCACGDGDTRGEKRRIVFRGRVRIWPDTTYTLVGPGRTGSGRSRFKLCSRKSSMSYSVNADFFPLSFLHQQAHHQQACSNKLISKQAICASFPSTSFQSASFLSACLQSAHFQ